MSTNDVTADDASFSKLVIGRRPRLSAAVALVALVVSALVAFGAIVAVALSGPTLVRGADGVSILEWASPLAVWQWLLAGVIEFGLIGASAAAWWGAWSLWAGRDFPGLKFPSPRPFALGAGVAMIAAAVLALVTHFQNWRDWHALVVAHPEWGEGSQAWQIPVGAVAVVLLVGAVLVVMLLLRKRPLAR